MGAAVEYLQLYFFVSFDAVRIYTETISVTGEIKIARCRARRNIPTLGMASKFF